MNARSLKTYYDQFKSTDNKAKFLKQMRDSNLDYDINYEKLIEYWELNNQSNYNSED